MNLLSAVDLLLLENYFSRRIGRVKWPPLCKLLSISEQLIKAPHHNNIAVFSPLLRFIFNVQFFLYIYEKKDMVGCCLLLGGGQRLTKKDRVGCYISQSSR